MNRPTVEIPAQPTREEIIKKIEAMRFSYQTPDRAIRRYVQRQVGAYSVSVDFLAAQGEKMKLLLRVTFEVRDGLDAVNFTARDDCGKVQFAWDGAQ